MSKPRILCEVWQHSGGAITVTTDTGGSGTRLCGPKAYGASKIAEFRLDRDAVDALSGDLTTVELQADVGEEKKQ